MDVSTQKYYLIVSVIKKGAAERMYPLVIDEREEAQSTFEALSDNNLDKIAHLTGDIGDAQAYPFLFVEKTYISDDQIIEEADEHGQSKEGKLVSSIIPVDYVSEVIAFQEYPELIISSHVDTIIQRARLNTNIHPTITDTDTSNEVEN